MQKADVTKMIIKVKFSYKDRRGRRREGTFPTSLQRWIQKSPEEQERYVAQHTKNKVLTYNIE